MLYVTVVYFCSIIIPLSIQEHLWILMQNSALLVTAWDAFIYGIASFLLDSLISCKKQLLMVYRVAIYLACKGANEDRISIIVFSILTAVGFFMKLGRSGNPNQPPQLCWSKLFAQKHLHIPFIMLTFSFLMESLLWKGCPKGAVSEIVYLFWTVNYSEYWVF